MDNDKYIGRLLDNRYEILEVIGTGGMAVVYKARCHRLNRLVAIKILKDDLSQDEEFRRRFHAESQAVAMLSHPNIMSVYDVSTTDEADYIVMELIDGITLKQYMEKKGVLNWKETLHFGMQIAKALEHAHSRGIVHRDIKPHNVMVLKNGSVKVTDFGIARIMTKSNTLTKEALGSVHYISPEQAKGGRVDARSDLYSLGVVMYEMMTGRPPYDGETAVAVAIQHINGTPPMPSVLNPNIPGGLEQIIMKAMEKDPAKRYASATEMLYDLEEFRKNPSILFNFKSGSIDDVVPLVQNQKPASLDATQTLPPRTTAERVAGVRTPRPGTSEAGRGAAAAAAGQRPASNQRPAGQDVYISSQGQRSTQSRPQNRNPQNGERRPAHRPQADQTETRNRNMTIAVVTCSAIAVVAIVIFLVVTLNGGLFGGNKLIPVPDLVGQVFNELDRKKYPDFEIEFVDHEYNDTQPDGTITRQKPEANEKVAKGSKLSVWVSMGVEPTESTPGRQLDDLVNMTQDAASTYLKALDLRLVPIFRQENSDEIEEGKVVRTEPAAGESLREGQTVVVYMSIGPAEKTANVPNVVEMDADKAIKTLKASGFEKTRLEREDSLKPENEVLRLSVDVNTKVDVNTEIILYVSSGVLRKAVPTVIGLTENQAREALNAQGFTNVTVKHENNGAQKGTVYDQSISANVEVDTKTEIVITVSDGPKETVPPTTEAPKPVTKTVSIDFTDYNVYDENGKAQPFKATVIFNGKTVAERMIDPYKESSMDVQLTGSGEQFYDIYINGKPWKTNQKVDFHD